METNMTDELVIDEEAGQNLFNQMMDLYWEDALEKRGLTLGDLWAAQVVFISPFKKGQFDGLWGEDNDYEVRINEEVEVVALIENASEEKISKGDPIRLSDIGAVKGIEEIPDFGDDVGHVTFIQVNTGEFHGAFDFIYNKSYVEPLVSAANEFLKAADYARENAHWRAFVENAIHGSERMMKVRVIQHGRPAHNHGTVESSYEMFANSTAGDEDLLDVYRDLMDLRYAATYVDPGDHPNGVDEKDFEIDPDEADEMFEVISGHFESLVGTESS